WSFSSPWSNCVGETRALPCVRMVTTAGAAAPTTSAYESRPPAMAWEIGVATVCIVVVAALLLVCASTLCHAAPATSVAAAASASPVRTARCEKLCAVILRLHPFWLFEIQSKELDAGWSCRAVTGGLHR